LRVFKFLLFFFVLSYTTLSFGRTSGGTLSRVNIEGNKRIDISIVKNYLKVKEGSTYNSSIINDSVKALYDSGLFETVDVNVKNNILNIKVVENPLIADVIFDGNKKIDDDILLAEISSTKRSIFDKNKVNNDIKRILDLYRRGGRFLATVEPKIVKQDENRVKLIFKINEGKVAKINKIYFVGAEKFSQDELKSQIYSKESKYLSFNSGEIYDPARITYDSELLKKFYFSKGYADFEVLSSIGEIEKNNKWFNITFLVNEGEKYNFGEIKITNNIKKIDIDRLKKVLKVKSGKIFNADLINLSIDNITNELAKDGFVFVDVGLMTKEDKENKTVSLNFVINESPRVYVGQIKIIGNTRTYDQIIRRELRLEEGDPFSISKFERSVQRIKNLGYFEKVDVQKMKTDQPNKLDIIITVQEKKTGELNFSVGYSTTDGANVMAGIKENNLFGLGQTLSLSTMYAQYTKSASISYGKPYLFDRDLYAGFNLFYQKDENEYSVDYDEVSYGGGVNASYSVTEYLSQKVFYNLSKQEIKNVQDDYNGIIEEGNSMTSSIGQTLYYDKRDSKFDTTSGYNLSWTLEYAGLGGDKDYVKNTGIANIYFPVWPSIFTLRIGGKAGAMSGIGQDIQPVDAFYLGGNSLKGFTYGGVGPRTIVESTGSADGGSAVGGKEYYTADAELKFPLGLPKEYGIYGSFFVNAGTLTGVDESDILDKRKVEDSGSIRSAGGFSLSWKSPIGPLSFDFSKVIKKEKYDDSQNFNFSFGSNF